MNKIKILAATMALIAICSTNAVAKSEEQKAQWKAFKDCKARVEQGSDEDCSALKPNKGGKDWKKEKGKDCQKNKDKK